MRRGLRVVAALLLATGSVLVALPGTAAAAELADAGWWYVRPGVSGKPPTVPEGGLYVAGAPDGAVSIAAVRFTVGEEETSPKLTLTASAAGAESDGGGGSPSELPVPGGAAPPTPPAESQPVILACQAGSGWSGEEAGSADAAPKVACGAGSAKGEASGNTWTWDLSALQVKTTVDVILVAGKVEGLPEGANGSTFQLAFEKPTAESLETLEGVAPAPFTPPGGGAGDFGGAPDLSGGAADGFTVDDGGGGGSFDTGTGTDVAFDAGDDTTSEGPALSEEQQGLTPTAPLVQAQQPGPEVAAADNASTTRDTRALGIFVLILGAVAGVAAAVQPAPPLQGLGRFRRPDAAVPAGAVGVPAAAPVAGLGRFARVRTGRAPKL